MGTKHTPWEAFTRQSSLWHDEGFKDGLRGVMGEVHPNNPYLGIYAAGYEAGRRRKLLDDAAPELLEFAKEFLRVWADAGVTDSPLEAQARTAISKATGE